jgi:deazaflavin-dependent oxidoreductase (nitroreductase family)
MRAFTKRVLNPLILGVAGRRHSADYAILRHVGRRSGRWYATPVVAHPVADGFLIALPYGAIVDWCGNLQAAGRGSLQWHGKRYDYEVGAPEALDAAATLPLLPDRIRRALGPFHIEQFLRLRWLTTTPAELAIPSGTAQRAR